MCQHQLPNRIEILVPPTCLTHVSLSVTSTLLSHWDEQVTTCLTEKTLVVCLQVRVNSWKPDSVSAEADLGMLSMLMGYVEVQL